MAGIVKNILAAGITLGLSDKEAFVKKVSEIIEDYQANPAKAEKWASTFVNFAEEYKDNIRLQNSIETILDKAKLPDKDSIKQLTEAIARLAGEVEELKAQKRSGHV